MNEQEANEVATQLLTTYGDRGFEISMPDHAGYVLMREVFLGLGRQVHPNDELYVVRVPPTGNGGEIGSPVPPITP